MIRTVITPQQTTFPLDIPKQYVGKQLEILLFCLDEVTDGLNLPSLDKSIAEAKAGKTVRCKSVSELMQSYVRD
jgi:hypothetical protein